MTRRLSISTYILTLVASIVLLMSLPTTAQAQIKLFRMEKDSIPFFRGFSVSFDLVGPAKLMLSTCGEYEGALRINLHDQWFPIFELGIGRANHENDEVTSLTYKTTAPYFRLGMDINLMKRKHQSNRIYAGLRYAFTSYKVDITRENMPDPVWQSKTHFGYKDMACSMHWAEVVVGIDAKVFGPLHLGWMVRYKRRLIHNDGEMGNTWYVPGFGKNDKDNLSANFNVIIDI